MSSAKTEETDSNQVNTPLLVEKILKQPFFVKAPLVLIGIYIFFYGLYVLKDVFAPLFFAALMAILLNPLVNKMSRRMNRVLAIAIAVVLLISIMAALIYFLSSQIAQFSEMLPELKKKMAEIFSNVQQWVAAKFNISFSKQIKMLEDAGNSNKAVVGQTVGSILGFAAGLILMPIYIFLLLYYKPLIQQFLFESFNWRHSEKVACIMGETKGAIQSYVVGLLIEMGIIAALNSTALLIIGVPYALLLGCLGAILNLIPYLGGLIAIALPVFISLASGASPSTALYIIGAYTLIQLIDNNFIVPKIVSSKVSVNALASIVVVMLGGALWGVAGMFLSIPFTAVMKVVFDHVDELKPWGKLLGDTMPEEDIVGKKLTVAKRIMRFAKRHKQENSN